MNIKKLHICFLVAFLSFTPRPLPAEGAAEEILQKAIHQYSICDTYRDRGTAETVFIYSDHQNITKTKFSTFFARDPERFRFEFREADQPDSRYIIWASGKEVRTWWDVTDKEERPSSLYPALVGARGVC